MSHRTETLDPEIARELEALEAALAGAPGADPVLTALVRDVRADAPRMSPAFAAQLDERVREGFPRASWTRWFTTPRAFAPALGFAAAALAALVVTGALGGNDQEPSLGSASAPSADSLSVPQESRTSAAGAVAKSAPQAAPSLGANSTSSGTSAAPGNGVAGLAPGRPRRVERSAQLTLTTAPDDVQNVADDVVSVTQAAGGVVASSQVQTGDNSGLASFELRIPTAKLDDTLKRLSDLAHVGSLNQGSTDITAPVNSAADRLSEARAERRGLLRALARATTDRQVQTLRARLRANRSALSRAKGDLTALRRRANLASVSVLVQGTGRARGHTGGGAWTPRDALRDARRVLEVAVGVGLVAGAIVAPLALLGGLGAVSGRTLRRRRRAHALDGA